MYIVGESPPLYCTFTILLLVLTNVAIHRDTHTKASVSTRLLKGQILGFILLAHGLGNDA